MKRSLRLSAIFAVIAVAAVALPSRAEAQRADGATTLRAAYDRVLREYVDPLPPAQLLEEIWLGMAIELAAAGETAPPLPALPENANAAFEAFLPVFKTMTERLGGESAASTLAHAGIRTMAIARAECHTYFLTPARMAEYEKQARGESSFVGIGVSISAKAPYTVERVYPGSPAERAGVRRADVIIAVNGNPTADLFREELGTLIRGPEGSQASMLLSRPGAGQLTVNVTRGVVQIPVVFSEMLPDKVGYVELTTFTSSRDSVDDMRAALNELTSQGAVGWIVDVRGNGGGAQTALLAVLGLFLGSNQPVLTVTSRTGAEQTLRTTGPALRAQLPLAVLTGSASASASEIFASVLQDTGRARVFGQVTQGCANRTSIGKLPDGAGLAITNARTLAGPSRRIVDGPGVQPDEVFTLTPSGDPTLAAASAYIVQAAAAAR